MKITDFSLTVNKQRNTTDCHEMINELVNCFVCLHSCIRLCNPINCSPPGSPVHGIFQARILEWVAISFCRETTLPNNKSTKIYKAKASLGNLQIKKINDQDKVQETLGKFIKLGKWSWKFTWTFWKWDKISSKRLNNIK